MHPLDSLTAREIRATKDAIRAFPRFTELLPPEQREWRFKTIALKEPEKKLVLQYEHCTAIGDAMPMIPRISFTVLYNRVTNVVCEVTVHLGPNVVHVKHTYSPGEVQPIFSLDDFDAETKVKEDARVIARCLALGYPNMALVAADAWSITFTGDEFNDNNHRILQFFMYGKQHENDNQYAHPLDFIPVLDMTTGVVIRIDDLPIRADFARDRPAGTPTNVPSQQFNFDKEILGCRFYRNDVKPLRVKFPRGPSFTVQGNKISWQKFNIRISFNHREGVVLHNVTYKDRNRVRPLLYRASIAEMLVPYGDPRPPYHGKAAFDIGACGLGFCTNILNNGCDCIGEIRYIDAYLNDGEGNPVHKERAICIHEEDTGILLKHTDFRTTRATIARGRRLVIGFTVTLLNYDYAFYWYFNQDATIGFEVKATGCLSTHLFFPTPQSPTMPRFGNIVAPNVIAQVHQHLFAVRLDTMIDGTMNSISTIDLNPTSDELDPEKNPFGNGIDVVDTPLRNTTTAQTDICSEKSRVWRIYNPYFRNDVTDEPVSYDLIPRNGPLLLANNKSLMFSRGSFASHAMWVTRYAEDELFPAGYYVNQPARKGGIADWVTTEQNLENKDIVLWHVFGINHNPRVEDFPVMPVETCGFVLKPVNFFAANPALDVPEPCKKGCSII